MASDQATTVAAPAAAPPKRRDGVFTNHDFVKLWAGESVSLIGTQVTQFAMPLVAVLTLGAGAFQVGVLFALRFLPVIILSIFAGVWLDRRRRRPVLIVCASGSAVLIGLVPLASATGMLSIGLLYAVTVGVGILTMTFDVGALSYIPQLVEPRHLSEANGKIQASTAFAGISGPALAGFLIGVLTAPITLTADAVSYLFSAFGLISIGKPELPADRPEQPVSIGHSIAEGFRAVYGSKLLRSLLTQGTTLNLFFGSFITIFVVYAVRVLGLSAFKLGIVMAAAAVGGLCGALTATRVRNALGLGRTLAINNVGCAAFPLILLIPRGAGLLSVTVLVLGQFCYGTNVAMTNVNSITLRQVVTPKRLLARMNATYRMVLYGAAPPGGMLGGLLGGALGLRDGLVLSVALMTTPILWLLWSPAFRLKEMPSGPLDEVAPATTASPDLASTAKDGQS